MPRSRPPSSPRSCSLTPGGRQTVLGKHSEHQHIRLRDGPPDRACPGAHPDGVGDALAQRSLDVPAEDLLLAVVVHPPLADTGAGQRVQAAGFGHPQHAVELQRRWRKSKFHLSFIQNESATANTVYFSIFQRKSSRPQLTVSLAGAERMPNRLETRRPIPESIPWPCITARYCSFPEESALALNSRLFTEDMMKLPP